MVYREINFLHRRFNTLIEFLKRPQRLKFLGYRFKWTFFPKVRLVPKVPLNVDIEIADACNLRCKFCNHGVETIKNAGLMEESFAKEAIDQLTEMGVYSMKLNWRGEAALHHKLAPIIAYAKSQGFPEVQMNTNGIPFDEENRKRHQSWA